MIEQKYCRLIGVAAAQLVCMPVLAVQLTGSLSSHDPSRIYQENGRYYTFSTGTTFGPDQPIRSKYSDNLTHWVDGPGIFSSIPAWAQAEVPNNPGFMWAPDVFYFNNEYRLYYSVSSFGSQNSVIGMATNTTLDPTNPNYEWVDQQVVIESENGYPYNAIDPGIFYDDSTDRMWMTWGSFWNGIYITELDPATGKRLDGLPSSTTNTLNIARHTPVPPNAIEAPYLTEHNGFYYLFVNWDTCCQGEDSTYKIRVGRSTSPTGPFRDRIGLNMTANGGTPFLETEGNFIGPGHFSDYTEDGVNFFSYHYYDGAANGASKLAIEEFAWVDGWPVVASELPTGDYNRDGVVDEEDFGKWKEIYGDAMSIAGLAADGNHDGVISAADFTIWRQNFGATYGAFGSGSSNGFGKTVPEPAALYAAALGLYALLVHRRRTTILRFASSINRHPKCWAN